MIPFKNEERKFGNKQKEWEKADIGSESFSYSWNLKDYFNKLLHLSQLDVDYTFFQMMYLCYSPNKLYQHTKWRKRKISDNVLK